MLSYKQFLIKTLALKAEETTKFSLLFFHSFFVGLFIAFYFVQANAVFIKNYGSDELPMAYIIAGIAGYLTTAIYSALQKKIKSKNLFFGALLFMIIVTVAVRAALGHVDDKYLSYFAFIWAWPFISLVGIEAGGLAIKLLNLIQIKRLFGLINMGGVIASILGYLIIPLIAKIIGTSYNLLAIAAVSLAIGMALLIIIYKKFPEHVPKKIAGKATKKENNSFRELLKEKYFRLIFAAAALSMTVIYVADFGFLAGIKAHSDTLFADEGSVPRFLALVFAGLKVGELIISYFSSRILSRYGVKLGLTVMPIALTIIVIISAIVGFTSGTATIIFLVLMTLNKSMERILRRGLDDPAFNILYQPLPESLQLAVQTKVGVVMQFAIGIAGAFLLLIKVILDTGDGFKLEYFSVLFIPILVGWTFVAWRLYLAYKSKLREVLRELSKKKQREASKYQYGTEVLGKKFKRFSDNVVNLAVNILSETNPRIFEPYAASLLQKKDTEIQKAVLRSIDPTWRERTKKQIDKLLKTTEDAEVKQLASRASQYLDFKEANISATDITALVASKDSKEQLKVVKFLTKNKLENTEQILLTLLQSRNKEVKSAIIKLAVTHRSEKLIEQIILLLKSPQYYHLSTAAILDMGEVTLPYLEELFTDTQEEDILEKIIEIYAKMGSKPARSLIVAQLNYPSRSIQLAAIWALYYCKYQALEEEQEVVKKKVADVVENLLWILSAIKDIEDEKNTLKLFLALDQEKSSSYEQLFSLLSFLHDPRVISLIKKNIVGKNTIYALELIDNFIIQDLKPIIIPMFDDISVPQKIKKLSKYFPQKKLTFKQRLSDGIMRDFDELGNWTISKILEMMGRIHKKKQSANAQNMQANSYEDIPLWTSENIKPVLNYIKRSDLPDEVFLCLFHPDELVYSAAAKVVYDENAAKCIEYLSHMSAEKQKMIPIFTESSGYLLPDKVKLLRRFQLFFSIPDQHLVKIAKLIVPISLEKGDRLLSEYQGSDDIFIMLKGSLSFQPEGKEEIIFRKKIIITRGMNITEDAEYLTAVRKTQVLIINRYKYFNLLVDETEILQHIFDSI